MCPRLKELQNAVLKQCVLEKAQTVLDGKDNLCPESQSGEAVLLAGLWQRFLRAGARKGGSMALGRGQLQGEPRPGGGDPPPHRASERESGLGHLKTK